MKNYMLMPINYVQELHNLGKRYKARCFMEYFYDVKSKQVNSISFYAKSWDKTSKGSVHKWIKEFKEEIDLFFSSWQLYNNAHYEQVKTAQDSSVKKPSERQVNGNRTKNTVKTPINTDFQKQERTESERQVNEVFNIYNNNKKSFALDEEFMRYIQELRFVAGRYLGNIEDIYQEYLEIKDVLDIEIISKAYRLYIQDTTEKEKSVGLAKFIKDKIYLYYLPRDIEIAQKSDVVKGYYDIASEQLLTDDNRYKLSHKKFLEKLGSGAIRFQNG